MFEVIATFIDRPAVRISLVVAGVPLTLVLSPILLAGFAGALDLRNEFPFFVIACCGLAAIAAAWVRVLLGIARLRQTPVIRWLVAFGLALGVTLATLLAVGLGFGTGNPVPYVYMLAAVIGALLLVGTVCSQSQAN